MCVEEAACVDLYNGTSQVVSSVAPQVARRIGTVSNMDTSTSHIAQNNVSTRKLTHLGISKFKST